jgi:hypothetical protein
MLSRVNQAYIEGQKTNQKIWNEISALISNREKHSEKKLVLYSQILRLYMDFFTKGGKNSYEGLNSTELIDLLCKVSQSFLFILTISVFEQHHEHFGR